MSPLSCSLILWREEQAHPPFWPHFNPTGVTARCPHCGLQLQGPCNTILFLSTCTTMMLNQEAISSCSKAEVNQQLREKEQALASPEVRTPSTLTHPTLGPERLPGVKGVLSDPLLCLRHHCHLPPQPHILLLTGSLHHLHSWASRLQEPH